MTFKTLFTNGKNSYIIQLENLFYMIDLELKTISKAIKKLDSFLQDNYYQIKNTDKEKLEEIENIIALRRYCSTANGTITIGKLSEEELRKLNI